MSNDSREIQAMLDGGGDVWLHAATYDLEEPLKVPPRTKLRGDGENTILRCHPKQGQAAEWISNVATTGSDGNITIADMCLELAADEPEQTAIHLGTGATIPRGSHVRGITMSRFTRHAIRMDRCWASSIDGCTLIKVHAPDGRAVAISLPVGAHGMRVTGCYASACDAFLRADAFAALTIDGNVLDGGGQEDSQEHIFVSTGRALVMRGNYVEALQTSPTQHAIRLRGVLGGNIDGNYLQGEFGGAILTRSMLWIDEGCHGLCVNGNDISGVVRAVTCSSPDTRISVASAVRGMVEGDCVMT